MGLDQMVAGNSEITSTAPMDGGETKLQRDQDSERKRHTKTLVSISTDEPL